MKTRIVVLALLIAGALGSCRSDKKDALTALDIAKGKIQNSIDTLNRVLVSAAESLAGVAADPEAIRARLKQVRSGSLLTKEVAFITPEGNEQIIEPGSLREYEGTSLNQESYVKEAMQLKQPVFSGLFKAPEGFQAVGDVHPVVSGSTVLGAIESAFTPYDLIHGIRITLVTAPEEIWVMDQDGTVIYQQDSGTFGKNVIKDDSFSKFKNFQTACKTIAVAESGEVNYSYYATGTTNPVDKMAYWTTIKMHEKSWKIIYALEK
ncbi:MAG: hypothetical protein NTV01_16590 [Bacteroidia bacterium]|nr:hypothetical protein [Bacteroidia bacterium]